MNSLDLETNAPEGWFSQYDIAVLQQEVATIPSKGLYLEIGVYLGRSLWVATQVIKPGVEIWGIDILDDPKIEGTNFIKGSSLEVNWDKQIDVLFIDGDHSYEFVKAELEKYGPFVKKGGVILFHDYEPEMPGVYPAVNEWAEKLNLKVETFKKIHGNTSIAKVVI